MQALVGVRGCNREWMNAWVDAYRGDLGIALTDTVTSPVFFCDFDRREAKLFDGIRQDSGDPAMIAEMAIRHYESLGIDPRTKQVIFSDNLNDDKLIALNRQFCNRIMVTGGIGTFLTNDVGHKPLNIVIKLTAANFGGGMVPVVKLSDDAGKYTGPVPEHQRGSHRPRHCLINIHRLSLMESPRTGRGSFDVSAGNHKPGATSSPHLWVGRSGMRKVTLCVMAVAVAALVSSTAAAADKEARRFARLTWRRPRFCFWGRNRFRKN